MGRGLRCDAEVWHHHDRW